MEYLDFKTARCKDCFKCLRECPVKAIKYENHQAKIIAEKCILCGKCTEVCPQNAKKVHSELDDVLQLLSGNDAVVASVAPSFVSSFDVTTFEQFASMLAVLGFSYAEETAVGAKAVTDEYAVLLKSGKFKNFITSACPAINRMIEIYYPSALKYLAPVASPMVAHARMLKERFPKAKIVFIGPCIAKKREGQESGAVDAVLTFEELDSLFKSRSITPENALKKISNDAAFNLAAYYPVNHGIIKSFDVRPEGYQYITLDGVNRTFEVLDDIDSLEGMFIEVNCCEQACINGPCSVKKEGGTLKANEKVRRYVTKDASLPPLQISTNADMLEEHPPLKNPMRAPTESEIKAILARTGKTSPDDELNCGACGYSTCREKAIAVANGYADVEMCIPYMRSKAETMSYEIISNSPNGVIVMDDEYKVVEINATAKSILGLTEQNYKGTYAFDCFSSGEFMSALMDGKNVFGRRVEVSRTGKWTEFSIVRIAEHKTMFAVLKDITDEVAYTRKLDTLRNETLLTTDEVIKKQMRAAQEIASLLGESTAEAKVALLKLKQTLKPDADASPDAKPNDN